MFSAPLKIEKSENYLRITHFYVVVVQKICGSIKKNNCEKFGLCVFISSATPKMVKFGGKKTLKEKIHPFSKGGKNNLIKIHNVRIP